MSAIRLADRQPAAAPTKRPDLHVVTSVSSPRRYLLLAVLLAAVGVFGVVGLHAKATESAFSSRALSEEVEEYTLRAEELRAEVAALESPEHVRRIATEQLGMVPATQPGYLVADSGAAPAAPAAPVAVGDDETDEG